MEELYMLWIPEDNEAVIYIAAVCYRFEMGRTVIKPLLFMIGGKNIRKGGTKGGTHGHAVCLVMKFAIKNE